MENYENRMAVIVGKYATPLAVLLVGMGILLAQPPGRARKVTIFLLVFGIMFNRVMIQLIKHEGAGRGLVMARLFVNVFANTITFYLLAPYWPPSWLLLTLTPIAAGIYSSRKNTLATAGIVSGVILMVHSMRGEYSTAAWGGQAAHCLFAFLISLLINELSQVARAGMQDPARAG